MHHNGRAAVRGFTLIELIATIVLFGIISVVVGQTLFEGYKTVLVARDITDVDWQGNMAVTRFGVDIHRVRSVSEVSRMNSSWFTFVDVDGNTVDYRFQGGNWERNSQVLASGIQGITLTYLDKDGAATTNADDLRYISVALTAVKNNSSVNYSTIFGLRSME